MQGCALQVRTRAACLHTALSPNTSCMRAHNGRYNRACTAFAARSAKDVEGRPKFRQHVTLQCNRLANMAWPMAGCTHCAGLTHSRASMLCITHTVTTCCQACPGCDTMHHTSGCCQQRGTAGLPCGNAKGLTTPGAVLCFTMCCD